MNNYLYERLIKWGLRRHGNKTTKWVFNTYWKHINGRWTFTASDLNDKTCELIKYDLRQKKIRSRISAATNVFDLKNKTKIRQVQLAKANNLPYTKDLVWKKQQGICPGCNQNLDLSQSNILDLHPIVPKKDGGSDKLSNLLLMHEHCHYEIHSNKHINSVAPRKLEPMKRFWVCYTNALCCTS